MAWEAYCDDCIPIGAAVTGPAGEVLTRGRNHIYNDWDRRRSVRGIVLEHAEMDALRKLDYGAVDPHACDLYTTTEPCPMCLGGFYMSGLRRLHYASRDPYAGSVDLLGKTWYLSHKPIQTFGPTDPGLEVLILALSIEQDAFPNGGVLPEHHIYRRWADVLPRGIELGVELSRTGELQRMKSAGVPVGEVFDGLFALV